MVSDFNFANDLILRFYSLSLDILLTLYYADTSIFIYLVEILQITSKNLDKGREFLCTSWSA